MFKRSRLIAFNPPISSSLENTNIGQRLLQLVRALENDPHNLPKLQHAVQCLQSLIAQTSRVGLLNGNKEKIDHILAACTKVPYTKQQQKNGKRSRHHGGKEQRGGARDDNNTLVEKNKQSSLVVSDEDLIIASIVRIFASMKVLTNIQDYDYRILLIPLAADLCTAVTSYIQILPLTSSATQALAEYESLTKSGKQILMELCQCAQVILLALSNEGGRVIINVSHHKVEHINAIFACLRAIYALLSVYGDKLSRATALVTSLRDLGYKTLLIGDNNVVNVTCCMLAALSTIVDGNMDRTITPNTMWKQCMIDTVSIISLLLEMTLPKKHSSNTIKDALSIRAKAYLEDWIETIQLCSNENDKVDTLVHIISSLALLFEHLLLCSDCATIQGSTVLGLELHIHSICELIETLITFPVLAESKYFVTKKRLRLEIVEGGILSPTVLVSDVANSLKMLGHRMLDTLVTSVGGPVLLPYARRIGDVVFASLLSSCGLALRSVLEPASLTEIQRRRWIVKSILVRTATIRSFHQVVMVFGIDSPGLSTFTHSSTTLNDVHRTISLVAGCLIEQIVPGVNTSHEWGTASERINLVVECTKCLTACLLSGGEYLAINLRELIESVAKTCLLQMHTTNTVLSRFGTVATIRVAFLKLGSTILQTPWPDGARSAIVHDIRRAAFGCLKDCDESVKVEAASAISTCDAMSVGRIPALLLVTRTDGEVNDNATICSAVTLAANLVESNEYIEAGRSEERKKILEPVAEGVSSQTMPKNFESIDKMQPIKDGLETSVHQIPSAKPSFDARVDALPSPETEKVSTAALESKSSMGDEDEDIDFPIIVEDGPDQDDA